MKEQKFYRIPAVGRLVQGNLYTPQTPSEEMGGEKYFKSGNKKGELRKDYFFAVAFKKGAERSWQDTEWGKVIKDVAIENWDVHVFNNPKFASKVIDGDSTIANTKGRRPCDHDGFPGHWVLRFSTGFAFKICDVHGRELEKDFVRLGDYVEVLTDIRSNGSSQTPGIFLNPVAVAFRDRGIRIESESVDLSSVGFGAAPMPLGAELVREETVATFDEEIPPMEPYNSILTPPAPIPVPAPSMPRMTAKATHTYDQYKSAGWTDEQLFASGFME